MKIVTLVSALALVSFSAHAAPKKAERNLSSGARLEKAAEGLGRALYANSRREPVRVSAGEGAGVYQVVVGDGSAQNGAVVLKMEFKNMKFDDMSPGQAVGDVKITFVDSN